MVWKVTTEESISGAFPVHCHRRMCNAFAHAAQTLAVTLSSKSERRGSSRGLRFHPAEKATPSQTYGLKHLL